MTEHPFGFLSILPPVVAIILAIATRRVVVSLLAGVFIGALVLSRGDPAGAVGSTLTEHLWPALVDEDNLHVFAFTTLMGVMVGIISRAAGMRGLVDVLTPLARSRRGGQLTTWALGLFVFFDDYANTLLLGNTLRPLTDRLKISREKLAYLVDSTAAPVSGLALVSTWVAGEIRYIQDGLDKLPVELEWSALGLFLASIPYRFYVLWALAMVPLVALLNRDFGPMWRAEQDAVRKGVGKGGLGEASVESVAGPTDPDDATPARWYNAVVPIVVTVGVILWIMYRTGRAEFAADAAPSLMEIFGGADAYGSLLWGALTGAALAAVMVRLQGLLDGKELKRSAAAGGLMMAPALVILWLASALSAMTGNQPSPADGAEVELQKVAAVNRALGVWKGTGDVGAALNVAREESRFAGEIADALVAAGVDAGKLDEVESGTGSSSSAGFTYSSYRLYTGAYLTSLLKDRLPFGSFPTVIFVLSAAIAFATGTSWGTMGIVMPLAVPLVYQVGVATGVTPGSEHPIILGVIGGVLAGAIFGDHCSPISDTTILSSQASGCDHVAHVWTQLPYALSVALVSVVVGTLPVALGVSVWLVLPVGVGAIAALLWFAGKPTADR